MTPAFQPFSLPTLPNLNLSDTEVDLLNLLWQKRLTEGRHMQLAEAYYLGEQVIDNLRIAVPKELEFLRTIVGWPALAVDPLVERLEVDGFRMVGSTNAEPDLMDVWALNGLDGEQSLAFTDALSLGRGYWAVGTGDDDVPVRVTVESPLNMTVLWDLSGRSPEAALQSYWGSGRMHGALYLQGETIHLAVNDKTQWTVVDRDKHGFPPPIVRMANRPRSSARDGRSEITTAIRSITDAACRTLLGLEVAREFYSVPQRIILGASEEDFVNAQGERKTAWETYITAVLGLQRDENGDLPQVHQMTAYDPGVFTRLIEMYASQMASLVAAPPQDLGLYTQGNPVSAESNTASESRRDRRAKLRQKTFGPALVEVMQLAMRFSNGGSLPPEFRRMQVDWADVEPQSPTAMSDAITKQIAAGSIPPRSDVTLRKLGYNPVERQRLDQDWQTFEAEQALQQTMQQLTAPPPQPEPNSGEPSQQPGA